MCYKLASVVHPLTTMLRRSLLLAVLLASGCRGQLLSNEDHPPLIDRLLQVVWEPSSLIRWWTALDQMYNVALGWRRAARSLVNLPFQGRAMEDHVTFQAPRWSRRKADLPHWERFKKVYEPYLPDVPEAQLPPEFLFRPREVFVGGLDLKDLAAMASSNFLQERGGNVPPHSSSLPGADFLGLLQAIAGQGKGLPPFGSVNMADLGTLASFIDYKNAHSGQGLVQKGGEQRQQGPVGQHPLGLNMEDLKALATFADLEYQKNFQDMLRAQNGKEGFKPDLKGWASAIGSVESQKHFKDLTQTQSGKGPVLNKDYLKDLASALENQKHFRDLFQAQNTKEGSGSLNKDSLKTWASAVESEKYNKDIMKPQNNKEGPGGVNKDYLKAWSSTVDSQKYLKDLLKAQIGKEGLGGLNKDSLKAWALAVAHKHNIKDLAQAQSMKEGRKTHPGGSFSMADYGLVPQPTRTPEKVQFLKTPDVPIPNPSYNLQNQGGDYPSPFGLSNIRINAADLAKLKSLRPSGRQTPQNFGHHPPLVPGGPPPMFFGLTPDPQVKLRLFLNLMQKLGEGRVNPVHFDDERTRS